MSPKNLSEPAAIPDAAVYRIKPIIRSTNQGALKSSGLTNSDSGSACRVEKRTFKGRNSPNTQGV